MNRDLLSRGGGLVMIAAGCALAWWGLVEPLGAAQHGAAEVSYRMKSILVVPFGFIFGLLYLIGGARADALVRDAETRRMKLWGWVIAAASFGLGVLLYLWFQSQVTGLGYVQA